jgi:hypothetical protein
MEAVTIHPPEGYEVCPTSTQTEIRFRPIVKSKPKWEDFGFVKGYYVNDWGYPSQYGYFSDRARADTVNMNVWPTLEEAEACLALSQLCQWRDKYNEGWKPDWSNSREHKWTVGVCLDIIKVYSTLDSNAVLSFKTSTIRDKFVEDFRELIETAKPLL